MQGLWYGCRGLGGLQASGLTAGGKKQGIQYEQLVCTEQNALHCTDIAHCTDIFCPALTLQWSGVGGCKVEQVVVQFILSRVEYELCASALPLMVEYEYELCASGE